MHIPDGYLSPQTCLAGYAVAAPMVALASQRVSKVVKTRNVPLLAVFAALSFLVMMFNIPIPDGTTAHAVGGVIIAIALGPWAAVIAVAVALLFQALLFGDGGVLSYGVNVLNMAILLPFVGYAVYRLIAGRSPLSARRRIVAAAVAGYAGINTAALATAIELGIQPDLFHNAAGAPLYSPYHLAQTIPAMALAHLTIAGAAEAILTAGVLAYLVKADVRRLVPNHPGIPMRADGTEPIRPTRLTPGRVALGFIAIAVVLTPIGLLAPGGAFGEDSPTDLQDNLGLSSIPEGLARYNGFWSHTLLGDYGAEASHPTLAYILSAIVGIAIIAVTIFLVGKAVQLATKRTHHDAPDLESSTHDVRTS